MDIRNAFWDSGKRNGLEKSSWVRRLVHFQLDSSVEMFGSHASAPHMQPYSQVLNFPPTYHQLLPQPRVGMSPSGKPHVFVERIRKWPMDDRLVLGGTLFRKKEKERIRLRDSPKMKRKIFNNPWLEHKPRWLCLRPSSLRNARGFLLSQALIS